MNQCQSAREVIVSQIGEILAHLHTRKHSLIDDILVGQRADIEVLVRHALLYLLPYYI